MAGCRKRMMNLIWNFIIKLIIYIIKGDDWIIIGV